MALNWDTTGVANPPHRDNTLPDDVREGWETVLNRIIMVWCANNGMPVDINANEIACYIGLRTNVVRLSRFKWDEKQRKLHGFK